MGSWVGCTEMMSGTGFKTTEEKARRRHGLVHIDQWDRFRHRKYIIPVRMVIEHRLVLESGGLR